ncbi:FtsK/SpoIIIE domain-containing protein [Nocardia blacklockiae]|uniref:FtsK/SpoIIIE domain-containing protein n=1 Tax=Nocardia blacklockiae TaxID=480036 RepID=UPI001894B87B|nr:FtsK/SpoIIIE domain-containing protein [Nocardia blacklockiae]MBF6171526.1 hypothetical protein [Nocardia blacklockiae]
MTVTTVVPYAVAAAGALGFAARMFTWSRIRVPKEMTAEDHARQAPAPLRLAVFTLCDPLQGGLLWASLGLGSPEVGFPVLIDLAYAPYGLDVELQPVVHKKLRRFDDEQVLADLAGFLGVPKVTVSAPDPGFIRLQVRVHDTLAAPATVPVAVHNGVDLEAVPVGVTELGDAWLLRVLYAHILLAGATGSGKGSVLWSLIAGIGPAIRDGLVDVWLADPKGGAEFGRGERLWVRFEWDIDGILAMLGEAVEVMRERLARMRETGVRKHVPTPDAPLVLIVIDEAAALSSYATREQQELFRQLTGVLLSQGRAAAVGVVAALQDPSKETMPNRQLFPVRIGLRLDEPTQTAMVHGQGSRARGARCDEISDATPGVGYVGEDGTAEFVRVRAFWVSNDDIDRIVELYARPEPDFSPQADYSDFDPDDLGDDDGGLVAA